MYLFRYWRLVIQGWREAFTSNGETFDGTPHSDRSRAYDAGRRWRKRGGN